MFKKDDCKLFMKKCSRCKELKLVKIFGKDKYGKFGLKSMCKDCEKIKYKKTCLNCNKVFRCANKSQECCSRKCGGEYQRKNNNFFCKCDICGKDLELNPARYHRSKYHYCSVECMGKGESKFHIGSEGKNFKNATINYECDVCGKKSSNLQSEYNKYKYHYCSYECKCEGQTLFYSGENSKLYKEDALHDSRQINTSGYQIFIKKVLKRDNYTCQCCLRKKRSQWKA